MMTAALPAGWVPAPTLSDAALSGTCWTFGQMSPPLYTPFLVLAPDGLIGNYANANEDLWQVVDGRLAFLSDAGVPTTVFDGAKIQGDTVTALCGRVLIPAPDIFHVLQRTGHPVHPLHATPQGVRRHAPFLRELARPQRSNLVVLRAGPDSLHTAWPRDIDPAARSWDLCISYYGPDPGGVQDEPEYLTHQPAQRKFQALHDLFAPGSPLWAYERVWFPDDDIMTSWGDINRIFHLGRRYGLDLCQPALRPGDDCHILHDVTEQQPGSTLRFVSFVEIMCPVFSARALRICVGSFRDSVSGFGLDHLWPALLGGPRTRIAMLDAVGVVHTRPFGKNYDLAAALREEKHVLRSYQIARVGFPPLRLGG